MSVKNATQEIMHKLHSPYMVNFPQKDSVHTLCTGQWILLSFMIFAHIIMLTLASTRVQEVGCDVEVITSAA